VPGVGGLELRNVDANYRFERSHRFAGIQPNSGFGDYSRLNCGVGNTQLGRRPGSRQGCLRATPVELARISGTVNQVVPLAESQFGRTIRGATNLSIRFPGRSPLSFCLPSRDIDARMRRHGYDRHIRCCQPLRTARRAPAWATSSSAIPKWSSSTAKPRADEAGGPVASRRRRPFSIVSGLATSRLARSGADYPTRTPSASSGALKSAASCVFSGSAALAFSAAFCAFSVISSAAIAARTKFFSRSFGSVLEAAQLSVAGALIALLHPPFQNFLGELVLQRLDSDLDGGPRLGLGRLGSKHLGFLQWSFVRRALCTAPAALTWLRSSWHCVLLMARLLCG
jgi:hypothetical protein